MQKKYVPKTGFCFIKYNCYLFWFLGVNYDLNRLLTGFYEILPHF